MSDNLSQNIKAYQEVVYENSPVVEAYFELVHFVRKLRTDFTKTTKAYKVGNVSEGYMDFTYFPIFNEELREKKLKYGIVLNHQLMQFELWLMAHNENGKTKYWNQLKNTPWNEETVKLSVIKNKDWPLPFLIRDEKISTLSSKLTVDEACVSATKMMVSFVENYTDLTKGEAIHLLSLAGDLQICQVVDPNKTVRMELPLNYLKNWE